MERVQKRKNFYQRVVIYFRAVLYAHSQVYSCWPPRLVGTKTKRIVTSKRHVLYAMHGAGSTVTIRITQRGSHFSALQSMSVCVGMLKADVYVKWSGESRRAARSQRGAPLFLFAAPGLGAQGLTATRWESLFRRLALGARARRVATSTVHGSTVLFYADSGIRRTFI